METAKIIVVGAGPAGIATAVEAREAGIGPVIVLEKQAHLCDTVVSLYHQGKRVDPVYRKVKVEPTGKLSFDTETREDFLRRMAIVAEDHRLDIRFGREVQKIISQDGLFHVYTGKGEEFRAPVAVIAIGIFGKPIKPSYPIPAEVKDKVHFSLPREAPEGKKVLVVGGGDAAAEAACFLANKNEVALSYRRSEFFRINELNYCNLNDCACLGKINLMMATDIKELTPHGERVMVRFAHGEEIPFDFLFYNLGGMTPAAFLESIGVEMTDKKPRTDIHGETDVERLFLAGDLVVEKGTIMAAFNSGKAVIDRIASRYGSMAGAEAAMAGKESS
ncbi:MAG: NAD(P)-binding domain-containing protein [Desulfobacteraceae bacterium]|nr:NAD(P)-binding domain-containing protein [Desulfobacteraceae bacterium]